MKVQKYGMPAWQNKPILENRKIKISDK